MANHRVPREILHPDLVRAARAFDQIITLAALADFANYTQLSTLLNGGEVPVSALTIARLTKLASVIGYEGPLFVQAVTR